MERYWDRWTVDQRVDNLRSSVILLQSDMKTMKSDMGAMKSDIGTMNETLQNLHMSINALLQAQGLSGAPPTHGHGDSEETLHLPSDCVQDAWNSTTDPLTPIQEGEDGSVDETKDDASGEAGGENGGVNKTKDDKLLQRQVIVEEEIIKDAAEHSRQFSAMPVNLDYELDAEAAAEATGTPPPFLCIRGYANSAAMILSSIIRESKDTLCKAAAVYRAGSTHRPPPWSMAPFSTPAGRFNRPNLSTSYARGPSSTPASFNHHGGATGLERWTNPTESGDAPGVCTDDTLLPNGFHHSPRRNHWDLHARGGTNGAADGGSSYDDDDDAGLGLSGDGLGHSFSPQRNQGTVGTRIHLEVAMVLRMAVAVMMMMMLVLVSLETASVAVLVHEGTVGTRIHVEVEMVLRLVAAVTSLVRPLHLTDIVNQSLVSCAGSETKTRVPTMVTRNSFNAKNFSWKMILGVPSLVFGVGSGLA